MAIRNTKQTNDIEAIPELPAAYTKLILSRTKIDPEEEWNEIREWISSSPTSLNDIRESIKISADMIMRARDLYDMTSRTHKSFQLKCKARMQLWRYEAIKYWEALGVKKQTTEQMIEDYILDNYQGDYVDLQERANDIALLTDSFKALCENVYNKSVDLRKLLDSASRKNPTTPNWMDNKVSNR